MPHTYMRTSLARRGLNSSFWPVSELWILSIGLQAPARGLRRHELEKGRQFGPVCLAGQGDSERHEQVGALASRAFFQDLGQLFEVRGRLVECIDRGREEVRARRR